MPSLTAAGKTCSMPTTWPKSSSARWRRRIEGAKAFNLRGAVVDLATFHRALIAVAPEAADLVTFGDRQLGIAYDLDDSALRQRSSDRSQRRRWKTAFGRRIEAVPTIAPRRPAGYRRSRRPADAGDCPGRRTVIHPPRHQATAIVTADAIKQRQRHPAGDGNRFRVGQDSRWSD